MDKNYIEILKKGGIGVIPTDTVYGISTQALNKESVERLRKLKGRDDSKPFIVLISSIKDLDSFNIKLSTKVKEKVNSLWPGAISISLPFQDNSFKHIHGGNKRSAFRLPDKESLLKILRETGPLISTSVNPEGKEPAKNIKEAKAYFDNKLDFYIDEGDLPNKPSKLVQIIDEGDTIKLRD